MKNKKNTQKWLNRWKWELICICGGVLYAVLWVAIPSPMELTDPSLRNSINTLLQNALVADIVATSILFPASIAIYFTLDKAAANRQALRRFYLAPIFFLFSIILGIWNVSYIPMRAHLEINLAIENSVVVWAIAQYWFFFVGAFQMFLGGIAYSKRTQNQ